MAGRRSFFKLAGSLLAGGVGVVALGSNAAAGPGQRGSTQCTDYCYTQLCNGCPNNRHRIRCYTPDGRWYQLCMNECVDFCV